jgi:hypothetical protein
MVGIMKSLQCDTIDTPYIKEFFTEHGIKFTLKEIEHSNTVGGFLAHSRLFAHSYEVTVLSDEDRFLLELHGGWQAVIDYTLMARKDEFFIYPTPKVIK